MFHIHIAQQAILLFYLLIILIYFITDDISLLKASFHEKTEHINRNSNRQLLVELFTVIVVRNSNYFY